MGKPAILTRPVEKIQELGNLDNRCLAEPSTLEIARKFDLRRYKPEVFCGERNLRNFDFFCHHTFCTDITPTTAYRNGGDSGRPPLVLYVVIRRAITNRVQ